MDLSDFQRIAAKERGLVVVSTARPDGSIQSSVVNAGILKHPVSGIETVGIVVRGGTVKLRNLRLNPRATVTARSAGEWTAVEGQVTLIGPDDVLDGFGPGGLPQLLRDVFTAAGGTHDDWPTYDRVMAEQRRTAMFIEPTRVYSNRPR